MEWVETTARTVDEAKELLLDQLGVDEPEAEFEVIEEPKPGLFGRTKGQARVRARVRPKTPAARDDRRRRPSRNRKGEGTKGGGASDTPKEAPAKQAPTTKERRPAEPDERAPKQERASEERETGPRLDSAVAEREAIAFLQGVVDEFGLDAAITGAIDEAGDVSVEITGTGLGRLIGPRGGVIAALEELTRTRLQHVASGGSTPRFKLDVGGYRGTRRDHLEILVDEVVEKVRSTGQPHVLDVVLAGERKLVHDRVAETAPDLSTHSEGEDPVRRVVLSPS